MKFLCLDCDRVMAFAERQLPGDGTMAAVFACGKCGREMALLTNPMETRLVSGLGIQVGGRAVPEQPMELLRSALATGGGEAFEDEAERAGERPTPGSIPWSDAARERLQVVPPFVRGMVKRIYGEYAAERGIAEITPEIMDRARSDLGLEGM
ncbi:MAG TPA: PCP reductase family protein [Gemmatimonadota bacterium]|nr:PCP reductase family protein [Gemmatimonadota bacterium]